MTTVGEDTKRLRALVEAGVALSSELSLDALLQKLVEIAAELTGARYAALGVIDRSGTALERFVTHGVTPEEHEAIGDLPSGRGVLGVLISDAKPVRIDELADDPRSVGFPPNHPPMQTFLGVPVVLRGVAYGNLYLTEKQGGTRFTVEDEEIATLLAAQAAVAIENARLYESATRWLRQLESLNEVGNALLSEIELPRLLVLIARRLRELAGARLVLIGLPQPDGAIRIEAADGDRAEQMIGTIVSGMHSKSARILERRRSERVDSLLDDDEVEIEAARRMGGSAALYVPLMLRDQAIGVITVADKIGPDPRFSDDDLRLAEAFAGRASAAVDLSGRVARDAMRRVVAGQELERTRLARELHDETGQALTSILLALRTVQESDDVGAALEEVRELVVATLQDVRRLAVELRPSALDDYGLVPALERLTATVSEQGGPAIDLEAQLGDDRLPGEVETALYRIVQEALTNAIKHADAHHVSVVLTRTPDAVTAVVEDDGGGIEEKRGGEGLGLAGMRERLALLDGSLRIESTRNAGTTIVAEVPLR
ncbi:MAG TPA: GAF domain-containing sensor histidine kinase [Gaiellaceae bacterium]|nr:GAF domain-containing sensor histidine kinase [Gaiellaceae bacterium]